MTNTDNIDAVTAISDMANEASVHRTKIRQELSPEMSELRRSYWDILVEGYSDDYDLSDKDNPFVKTLRKNFSNIRDFLYYQGGWPKPESPARLDALSEKLAIIIAWFDYIDQSEVYEHWFSARGLKVTLEPGFRIEDIEYFRNPDVKNKCKEIFASSQVLQKEICFEADQITITKFGELPDEFKFDPKANRAGLKPSQFNKVTTVAAIKKQKEDTAKRLAEKIAEAKENANENQTIIVESVDTIVDMK